ncbi:hypothetical protein RJ639_038672 [Escallonia herrerae]|uniref:Uncharacterized protein n=1 Tax=Escallonia herrerae TaxID=1293975 RepID=A0AA88WR71_9ASTE|nr:hypothetical protein RJ639_038672 [Escallonia herrerae]
MTRLSVLDLGGNMLQGSTPLTLSNISSLEELNLGDNLLSGTIPEQLLARKVKDVSRFKKLTKTADQAKTVVWDGHPVEDGYEDEDPAILQGNNLRAYKEKVKKNATALRFIQQDIGNSICPRIFGVKKEKKHGNCAKEVSRLRDRYFHKATNFVD